MQTGRVEFYNCFHDNLRSINHRDATRPKSTFNVVELTSRERFHLTSTQPLNFVEIVGACDGIADAGHVSNNNSHTNCTEPQSRTE